MPESRASPRGVEPRVPFGVPAIDEMLEGGLMPHRPYLIVGPSGTGKTTLALQFLREGVRRGEPGLYVTVEDPPNEVRADHRSLGPEIDRIDVFDAIPDVMRYEHIPFKDISSVRDVIPFGKVPTEIRKTPEFTSVEVTISALEQLLRTEVQRRGYVRMVIDSLTALQYFCMKGIEPMSGAQAFLRFLSNLRTTALLTVESPLEDVESAERSLARGEIRLFRWELDGTTVRAVGVEKFRGSGHDVRLHPYRLGPNGVDINLELTISRDTRRIVEPALSVVIPSLVDSALGAVIEPPPRLVSLSEEVRDLVALGVDVAPVRTEVEAALAAIDQGRAADSPAHVARLSAMTIALAESLLERPPSERSMSKPGRDAFQRIVQRADAARGGVPPTQLPESTALYEQLRTVLRSLPPPVVEPASVGPSTVPPSGAVKGPVPAGGMGEVPAGDRPPVADTLVPDVEVPTPPATPPEPTAEHLSIDVAVPEAPSVSPAPTAPPAKGAEPGKPSVPPPAPLPATTVSKTSTADVQKLAPRPRPAAALAGPTAAAAPVPAPSPAAPTGERPMVDGEPMPPGPSHATGGTGARAKHLSESRPAAGRSRVHEPPVPPAGSAPTGEFPSAPGSAAASPPQPSGPGAKRREIPVRSLPEPPPLPTLFKPTGREAERGPPPTIATDRVPGGSGPTEASSPAGSGGGPAAATRSGRTARAPTSASGAAVPARRKRAPSARRSATASAATASGANEGGGEAPSTGEGPGTVPKRRTPRKRKAPPVVGAMPETPARPAPDTTASSGSAPPSDPSSPEPTIAPAEPSPPAGGEAP